MYIKFMTTEKQNLYVSNWLLLITLLVALMIIIGGLTRLTNSGLSITRWDLFVGIIPPLNLEQWETTFSLYKKIPEYKLVNISMTLEQFKIIFWWEYSHRLLGRLIGLSFILPLLFFTFKKILNDKKLISLYIIFFLICFQGFIGWYMVQSGLTERTDVSHFRLSLHLTLAFIIFIMLLWNLLIYKIKENFFYHKKLPFNLPLIFFIFIFFQIILGALLSGLDGGKLYQTWPLMNSNYFPDDSSYIDLLSLKSLNTPSLVQFIHRNIAYFIFFVFLLLARIIFKNNDLDYLRPITILIFLSLVLQIILGILTVLSGALTIFASMHQIGSILLITTSLILVFKNTRIN